MKRKLKDRSEVELLKKFVEVRCKKKPTKGGDSLRLSLAQVIVHGKKFVALVDMGATHSFLRMREKTSFAKKAEVERELSAFKDIKSMMNVVTSVLKNT